MCWDTTCLSVDSGEGCPASSDAGVRPATANASQDKKESSVKKEERGIGLE